MQVTAIATRSGSWWAVEVPEVEGAFSQARRLDEVPAMASDAVALLTGVDPVDVEVDVRIHLSDDVDQEIAAVRVEVSAAADAQRAAAVHQRAVARKLREHGLTGKDASAVLRVSPQRYSQLLNS